MSFWESPGGAATIGAGAQILSGAFGGGNSIGRQASAISRLGRRQMDVDIQRARNIPHAIVQGAKTAGISPLALLGSAGGGVAGSPVTGQSRGGNTSSDIVESFLRTFQQTSLYQAQKDVIEAQAEASRARAFEAAGGSTNEKQPDIVKTLQDKGAAVVSEAETRKSAGLVAVEPNKQRTRSAEDSSRAAGTNPAWQRIEIIPGVSIDVLWSEEGPAESLDNLPALAAAVARNASIGYQHAYKLIRQKWSDYYNRPGRAAKGANKGRVEKSRSRVAGPFIPWPRGPHR